MGSTEAVDMETSPIATTVSVIRSFLPFTDSNSSFPFSNFRNVMS